MKKLGDILQGAAFAEYRERAQLGGEINAAINAALAQTGTTARCKALSIKDGELTLAAASPAEAAMLRQLLPALTAALNKTKTGKDGITIRQIRLRIQP
ncbi:MAG: DciA family protein [Gammaproteobacteria bacterium]